MTLHGKLILLFLVMFNTLRHSTALPFEIQQAQDDGAESTNFSDKINFSDQKVASSTNDVKLKSISTSWDQFNLGIVKDIDKDQAIVEMKNLDWLAKGLSSHNSRANQDNLLIKLVTTTARPSYDQIPRPLLFDEDLDNLNGGKEAYLSLRTVTA